VQLVLAMGLGMPLPRHPVELTVAFTFVAFAFIGVGLVIAMLADNVPAVQALGQCIFLPMLIIGGVAVPLESLPDWAQRLSSFLPGRYAVQAIQACANGNGLAAAQFSLAALLVIGAAGSLAGAGLFRWDRDQRFATQSGKGWVAVALIGWLAVGLAAEVRRRVTTPPQTVAASQPSSAPTMPVPQPAPSAPQTAPAEPPRTSTAIVPPATPPQAVPSPPDAAAARPPAEIKPPSATETPAAAARPAPAPDTAPPPTVPPEAPPRWQAVTLADIERDLTFDRLPRDTSIVTPIAVAGQEPDQDLADEIAAIGSMLPTWPPGQVADPVQRARNLLSVPGVIDVAQSPMEPFIPAWIFGELRRVIPEAELVKVLYWIAIHPEGGTVPTVADFLSLGIRNIPPDVEEIRNRTAIYGVKLLGRLTGHIR
jgi:ABC-2 type transporter